MALPEIAIAQTLGLLGLEVVDFNRFLAYRQACTDPTYKT